MTFPADDYTPFGYLANPYHRARSWSETEAGLVRSTDDLVGFGWIEPTTRAPEREAAIVLLVRWAGRLYRTRADFARLGYHSRHHSSLLFSYDWRMDQVVARLSFALAERDALVAELDLENVGALPETLEMFVLGRVGGKEPGWFVAPGPDGWTFRDVKRSGEYGFALAGEATPVSSAELAALVPGATADPRVWAGCVVRCTLEPGERARREAALTRGRQAARLAHTVAPGAGATCAKKQRTDDAFYAGAARPVGDWPDAWKRGWVYDLETTRACIFPAGGIFRGPWPSWMISWPRVVLAEGTLDLARLSYAAPDLALRAARTLLVDAAGPNVPCVFQGGEPNMVARDGRVCGTSPAWCLPFHNLWLLYCRTLDRGWLADVFPCLEAYLDFWLRERTDEEGWVVYACTWEAGEDCTPRLDPAGSGDQVVSRFVRPVELQATLSHSAAILARLAGELGDPKRAARWSAVADEYARRTQSLWDPGAGRYRDWDKRAGRFLEAPGDPIYWKTDPVRFSALSLTPIVAGIASAEQRARLREEIGFYDAPPWCLWPSWSYVVAEAATAAGWHDVAGAFAGRIVERVYRLNDRRALDAVARPTPGTAPEFWPLDPADFNGSDGYGWGATTTSLWVRQVFGFLDGAEPERFSFTLVPNLPADFLAPGRRFGFVGLPYRGLRFDVAYEVPRENPESRSQDSEAETRGSAKSLVAVVRADRPVSIRVFDATGAERQVEVDPTGGESRFEVNIGQAYEVMVLPDPGV